MWNMNETVLWHTCYCIIALGLASVSPMIRWIILARYFFSKLKLLPKMPYPAIFS